MSASRISVELFRHTASKSNLSASSANVLRASRFNIPVP